MPSIVPQACGLPMLTRRWCRSPRWRASGNRMCRALPVRAPRTMQQHGFEERLRKNVKRNPESLRRSTQECLGQLLAQAFGNDRRQRQLQTYKLQQRRTLTTSQTSTNERTPATTTQRTNQQQTNAVQRRSPTTNAPTPTTSTLQQRRQRTTTLQQR